MSQKLHKIEPGPRPKDEEAVYFYSFAPLFFEKHFGRAPSRTTLGKYLEHGYPIKRGGPRVMVPVYLELKRPMTTKQAMERLLTVIRSLERRHGIRSVAA